MRLSRLNTHGLFESLMKTSGGSLFLEKASQAGQNDGTGSRKGGMSKMTIGRTSLGLFLLNIFVSW